MGLLADLWSLVSGDPAAKRSRHDLKGKAYVLVIRAPGGETTRLVLENDGKPWTKEEASAYAESMNRGSRHPSAHAPGTVYWIEKQAAKPAKKRHR